MKDIQIARFLYDRWWRLLGRTMAWRVEILSYPIGNYQSIKPAMNKA